MQRVFRVFELARRAEALVSAGEGVVRRGEGVHEFFGVAQQLAPFEQLLLFTAAQLRTLQLGDLMAQRIHAAGLFRLVHLQFINLPPRFAHSLIARRIGV